MNRLLLVGVALLAAVLGCSTERSAPVSGRVTFDGKPLAGAHVTFQPLAGGESPDPGGGSYGATGADGSYTLQLVQGEGAGAVVGKHRVEIRMPNLNPDEHDQGNKRPKFAVNIPAKYNVSSELTCVVPVGGKSDANFDLKSK